MGSRALIQSVSHLASDRTHPVMRSCNSVFVPLRFCVCVVSRVHMTQPFGLTVVSPLLPCVNLQRGSERERRGGDQGRGVSAIQKERSPACWKCSVCSSYSKAARLCDNVVITAYSHLRFSSQ